MLDYRVQSMPNFTAFHLVKFVLTCAAGVLFIFGGIVGDRSPQKSDFDVASKASPLEVAEKE